MEPLLWLRLLPPFQKLQVQRRLVQRERMLGLGNVDNVSVNARLNRSTNVNAADTNYTTYMARGEALFSYEVTPTVNGCIAWKYE